MNTRRTRSSNTLTKAKSPSRAVSPKLPKIIPLPERPLQREETSLYLEYDYHPGSLLTDEDGFLFKPKALWVMRPRVASTNIEKIQVPVDVYGPGTRAHVLYYIENTGDSYGLSGDWMIVGVYPTLEQARQESRKVKENYKKGYFNDLHGIYVYSTNVKQEPMQDLITRVD